MTHKDIKNSLESNRDDFPEAAIFIKRTALEFLQVIFKARSVGSLKYSDDTKTEIQICDQHTVDLEGQNVRPAIVAVRGPISWQSMGLGGNNIESRPMNTGNITFSGMNMSSIAFSCYSRVGPEADKIAHIVQNSFNFFRSELRKYGFFSIKAMNMGSEVLVKQAGTRPKLFMVPVFIGVQVTERWEMSNNAVRNLRKLVVTTLESD